MPDFRVDLAGIVDSLGNRAAELRAKFLAQAMHRHLDRAFTDPKSHGSFSVGNGFARSTQARF